MLRALFAGCGRFGEIIDSVPGLSHRLLTERLDELQEAGLVASTGEHRPRYTLTDKGRYFGDVLEAIEAWNRRWGYIEP